MKERVNEWRGSENESYEREKRKKISKRERKEKDSVVEGNEGEERESMDGDLKRESSVGHFRLVSTPLVNLTLPLVLELSFWF